MADEQWETRREAAARTAPATSDAPDVSIVMPCLNEIQSLPHCIENAKDALARIEATHGLTGEIVIADNGSTDGSQGLAVRLGARVALVDERGYGAALIGGGRAARGRFVVMGDCDGSYDFTESVPMIGRLLAGDDVCMGSRFEGGIAPGAMPWKNRWIGNPVLTGVLNLFFRTGINDAHCGLRALTKDSFDRLNLSSTGMEFASEMVVKAALLRLRMSQVPATLSKDLRDRAPHLRPWRDGWRHLRYLFMLSPAWSFGVPAALMGVFGAVVLMLAAAQTFAPGTAPAIGDSWTVMGGAAVSAAYGVAGMGLAALLVQVLSGYRRAGALLSRAARLATFEGLLAAGLTASVLGTAVLGVVIANWMARGFTAAPSLLPIVAGTLLVTLGLQTAFGGVLLSVIGGNRARLTPEVLRPGASARATEPAPQRAAA